MGEVNCGQCGGITFSDAKFCSHCGKEQTFTAGQPGLTQAVRDASAGDDGEKKYGQQKWGLFETNSQRARGISTEQSLQELDSAVQHGVVVRQGGPKKFVEVTSSGGGAGGAGAGGAAAGGSGGMGNFGSRPAGGGVAAGGVGNFGSSTTVTTSGGSQGDNLNPAHMTRDGGAGAAFMQQHAAKEAAKYKPGYKGNLN